MSKKVKGEDTTLRLVKEYIASKQPVDIHYNCETGDWLYSIVRIGDDDPGFWLDAFKTKREALEFCKSNKLPVNAYYRDKQ